MGTALLGGVTQYTHYLIRDFLKQVLSFFWHNPTYQVVIYDCGSSSTWPFQAISKRSRGGECYFWTGPQSAMLWAVTTRDFNGSDRSLFVLETLGIDMIASDGSHDEVQTASEGTPHQNPNSACFTSKDRIDRMLWIEDSGAGLHHFQGIMRLS